MKIQQVIVDDLTKEQAEELHAILEGGDFEKIEAKLKEYGVEIPDNADSVHVGRVEKRTERRREPCPEEVVLIAASLAVAQDWPLLTEFLDVNARMVAGLRIEPTRLVKLMTDLTMFMAKRHLALAVES